MCHEYWARRERERAEQEEARRFWDVFRRETTEPPASEPEIRLDEREAELEGDREPAER
ncbi:MAG TPA: hypothetical protein VFS08_00585 [Gemmatimonadaceae bacterium]|nr:hypothetical protein [Gemmatimonadaceae bacterium]